MPHLSGKGMGVHKTALCPIPHLADKGGSVHKVSLASRGARTPAIYDWFGALSARLRRVRVVCGDWLRICGGDWQDKSYAHVGIFFDPPYATLGRDKAIYHCESLTVAKDVEAWCLDRGQRPKYRIVVAGYDDEYQSLLDAGWISETWSTNGGYSATARNGPSRGQTNRHRERLLFSPHCQCREQILFA